MNKRIKEIRESLGLSQAELGKALGIGRSAISRIESGTNAITETNIRILCHRFGINRNWLEHGEGDMRLKKDDVVIAEIAEMYNLSDLDKEVFKLYLKLGENDRRGLMSFACSLAGNVLENPTLYREYKQTRGELPKLSLSDIETEVAAYRAELERFAQRDTDREDMKAVAPAFTTENTSTIEEETHAKKLIAADDSISEASRVEKLVEKLAKDMVELEKQNKELSARLEAMEKEDAGQEMPEQRSALPKVNAG